MTPQQRSARFQADFDQHGDIRTGRIPLDPPMIIWANGLPWFPVYNAFYVLCGSWNTASYLVGRKYRLSTSEFYLGAALAPPEAVQESLEDSLTQLTLRALDTITYPRTDRTNGPVDLIHIATISRGQNKIPCRFIMNTDPTSYALVYQSKAKKDLAYARLLDLDDFHERVCDPKDDFPHSAFSLDEVYEPAWQIIPQAAFEEHNFAYGNSFPPQVAVTQDPDRLQLIPWTAMYGILDSFGNEAARRKRRTRRDLLLVLSAWHS